jgi:hypothetical protein
MNGLLLTEKEVVHVTQSSADTISLRRNSASGSRCVSPWQCLHAGARHGFERSIPMKRRLDLFPTHGQPAEAPWRLALVTVFQCMEHLTDRQEALAVRDRLAWKYALSLELTDTGFDHVRHVTEQSIADAVSR